MTQALFHDKGQFLHIAQRMARDMPVSYFLAEEDPYPKRRTDEIGLGYENIKVIDDFWKALRKLDKEKDVVVFPDVYNGGIPEHLKADGFNVFSALKCENIESNKKTLKKVLKAAGLPVVPTVYKNGLTEAQDYLKGKEDKWLKTPYYRGDFETYHYMNEFLSSSWFNMKRHEMGSGGETIEIMIEDSIDSVCECGFDTPMLNGEIPPYALVGYEAKDKAYACKVFDALPKILATVHDKMKPAFKAGGYQGWYSNELRVTDKGVPYYIDATCRFGSPPSEIYSEIYSNFSQAVIDLATGKMPVLKPSAMFGVQLVLTSDHAVKEELPIQFPKEIDRWVKLKNAKKVPEGYCCIPNGNEGYIGSVVAIGNNLKDTMKKCVERAEMIKGEDITFHPESFKKIIQEIEAGKRFGIRW